MMVDLYGIPNCDTVKKVVTWLNSNNIAFTFHDFKKEGVTINQLKKWCKKLGWETVFNSRSSTWRNIKINYAQSINETIAIGIMLEHPSVIKRPIVAYNNKLISGFNENEYIETILAH